MEITDVTGTLRSKYVLGFNVLYPHLYKSGVHKLAEVPE